jgi:hypothetical protein
MTTKIILCLLAFIVSSYLYSQAFPLKGNERWGTEVLREVSENWTRTRLYTIRIIELKSDTLIDGKLWFKIYSGGYSESHYTDAGTQVSRSDTSFYYFRSGCLREEDNYWIYRSYEGSYIDTVLNNKKSEGDYLFKNGNCKITAEYEDNGRKTWSSRSPSELGVSSRVIEGIGSVNWFEVGLFTTLRMFSKNNCIDCQSSGCADVINLGCFTQDGVHIYGSNCELIDSISNLVKSKITKTESQFFEKTSIYPNPTTDYIHVEGLTGTQEKIILYDVNGKKIDVSFNSDYNIDISHLTKGMYHVVIQKEGRNVFSRSILKL